MRSGVQVEVRKLLGGKGREGYFEVLGASTSPPFDGPAQQILGSSWGRRWRRGAVFVGPWKLPDIKMSDIMEYRHCLAHKFLDVFRAVKIFPSRCVPTFHVISDPFAVISKMTSMARASREIWELEASLR
jgi:hypothetical protein